MGREERAARAVTGLRVGVAILLIIHGAARISLGIVDDFGGFLSTRGFPAGLQLAWGATLFELAGGLLLAFGRMVRPIAALFCVELMLGIALVHVSEGWFVVGAGRNGMEYSALLIGSLLAVIYASSEPPGDAA